MDVNILLAKHLTSPDAADGIEVVYLDTAKNGTTCLELGTALFRNFFIIAVNIFVGQTIAVIFVDRIGRKILLGEFVKMIFG